ncbi:hypothetical protein U1Q18_014408, partial [Sarracenia purpurea var. burkii]
SAATASAGTDGKVKRRRRGQVRRSSSGASRSSAQGDGKRRRRSGAGGESSATVASTAQERSNDARVSAGLLRQIRFSPLGNYQVRLLRVCYSPCGYYWFSRLELPNWVLFGSIGLFGPLDSVWDYSEARLGFLQNPKDRIGNDIIFNYCRCLF